MFSRRHRRVQVFNGNAENRVQSRISIHGHGVQFREGEANNLNLTKAQSPVSLSPEPAGFCDTETPPFCTSANAVLPTRGHGTVRKSPEITSCFYCGQKSQPAT